MWRLFESTAQGRSHFKENVPCQDKTFVLENKGTYVIALADGAGSAALSHYGAEEVTKTIAYELCENFESYWEEKDASVARLRIYNRITLSLHNKAQDLQCKLNDLASTILAVAVCDDRFIAIHLGDGVIGYLKNSELKVASAPNNGEFSNITVFTTSQNAENEIKMIKAQSSHIQGFILMSDGPEACLYDKRDNSLASGLADMFMDAMESNEDIVNANITETMQETIVKRTYDDCSIALMVKCEENTYIAPQEDLGSVIDESISHSNLSSSETTDNVESLGYEHSNKVLPRNCLILIAIIIFVIIFYLLW